MRYKKSIFNVEVDRLTDGHILMYNTYSGIFSIMDKMTQNTYNDIENINFSSILDEKTIQNVDIMSKAGYIVDLSKDEIATVKLERATRRHPKNFLHIVIAPTMDCNMCCPYCFEDKNSLVMCDDIKEKLITFVETHLRMHPSIKYLSVVWYGGEPLLQKNIIYYLSKRFIELCTDKKVTYSARVLTNGALLDIETAERLKNDCGVNNVQITIDGMKNTHNMRRILTNGEDSFDIITKNIEICKDLFKIHVRVNVDKNNADEIESLTKYFLEEKGWINNPMFYLANVEDHTSACLTGETSCLEGEQFAEINIKSLKAIYTFNRDIALQQFFPRRKSVFCTGEGMFHYVVDPEGYLYNCYVSIGSEKNRTGHVSKPFVITSEYGKWLLTDIHEKCEKCEYLPMCMGGCGLYRLKGDGTPKCFKNFYTYKDILKLAYEDYVSQKPNKHSFEI